MGCIRTNSSLPSWIEESTLNTVVAGVFIPGGGGGVVVISPSEQRLPRSLFLLFLLFLLSPEDILMHKNCTFKAVFEIGEKYLSIYAFIRDLFII